MGKACPVLSREAPGRPWGSRSPGGSALPVDGHGAEVVMMMRVMAVCSREVDRLAPEGPPMGLAASERSVGLAGGAQ